MNQNGTRPRQYSVPMHFGQKLYYDNFREVARLLGIVNDRKQDKGKGSFTHLGRAIASQVPGNVAAVLSPLLMTDENSHQDLYSNLIQCGKELGMDGFVDGAGADFAILSEVMIALAGIDPTKLAKFIEDNSETV